MRVHQNKILEQSNSGIKHDCMIYTLVHTNTHTIFMLYIKYKHTLAFQILPPMNRMHIVYGTRTYVYIPESSSSSYHFKITIPYLVQTYIFIYVDIG